MPKQTNKPVHQIRDGALSVSIWTREHDGKKFYSANPQRAYTEDDGKTFKHTASFDHDDLPRVALLLQAAYLWIVNEKAAS